MSPNSYRGSWESVPLNINVPLMAAALWRWVNSDFRKIMNNQWQGRVTNLNKYLVLFAGLFFHHQIENFHNHRIMNTQWIHYNAWATVKKVNEWKLSKTIHRIPMPDYGTGTIGSCTCQNTRSLKTDVELRLTVADPCQQVTQVFCRCRGSWIWMYAPCRWNRARSEPKSWNLAFWDLKKLNRSSRLKTVTPADALHWTGHKHYCEGVF